MFTSVTRLFILLAFVFVPCQVRMEISLALGVSTSVKHILLRSLAVLPKLKLRNTLLDLSQRQTNLLC
jgi:hypothetical protein